MSEYFELSKQAVAKAVMLDNRPIDLVVWPETMFRSPLAIVRSTATSCRPDVAEPPTKSPPSARATWPIWSTQLDTPVLVGIDRIIFLADDPPATRLARAITSTTPPSSSTATAKSSAPTTSSTS